jgi:carnitine-CoA ligase
VTTDTYTEYVPTFSDRKLWNLPDVLRHHARVRPDSIYLDVPWQQGGLRYSYKECLTLAESTGRNLLDNGCEPGDRVVVMMPNRAEYILARLGLGVARLVEVSINVDYKGTFLAHQISTVSPHTAIVDPGFVERFLAIPEACSTLKNFVPKSN